MASLQCHVFDCFAYDCKQLLRFRISKNQIYLFFSIKKSVQKNNYEIYFHDFGDTLTKIIVITKKEVDKKHFGPRKGPMFPE